MPDKSQQKQRTNRVFKSLHKPLTYLGVERTLFYFVCVGAVGAFNLFNSILAGIAIGSQTATRHSFASWQNPNATTCVMTPPSSKSLAWTCCDAASR
jgi:hypothetical protein